MVEVNAQKMRIAATWDSALKGHGALDPLAKEAIQKKMTLERFKEEHPSGFISAVLSFRALRQTRQ